RFAYYPYGEERGTSAEGREKFGTYMRDSSGLDYADQRYYGVGTGRFGTPDRAGLTASIAADPGSWNRFVYTRGDPVNRRDPAGLADCDPEGVTGNVCPAIADGSGSGPDPLCLAGINCSGTSGGTGICDLGINTNVVNSAVCLAVVAVVAGESSPPVARYAAAVRLVNDCYWAKGTRFTVGYTREMDWQVVDQFGDPFYGSAVPTVNEKVAVTSGSTNRGKSWTDRWSRGDGTISPYGIFDDYYSANGGSAFSTLQSYFVNGVALQFQDATGKPFAGVGGTTLKVSSSKEGVTIDGTTSPRPCTDKDKKW
ncbi:MAG: hypothetical protein JST11_15580, partial [Acidobacteria bacterium]|nr:hypothetical protein [Acidobacteriota bacterium]